MENCFSRHAQNEMENDTSQLGSTFIGLNAKSNKSLMWIVQLNAMRWKVQNEFMHLKFRSLKEELNVFDVLMEIFVLNEGITEARDKRKIKMRGKISFHCFCLHQDSFFLIEMHHKQTSMLTKWCKNFPCQHKSFITKALGKPPGVSSSFYDSFDNFLFRFCEHFPLMFVLIF